MGSHTEKKICIGCPYRRQCVELIYSKICPQGLLNVSPEEARDIQSVWKGEMKLCPTCNGRKYVKI